MSRDPIPHSYTAGKMKNRREYSFCGGVALTLSLCLMMVVKALDESTFEGCFGVIEFQCLMAEG